MPPEYVGFQDASQSNKQFGICKQKTMILRKVVGTLQNKNSPAFRFIFPSLALKRNPDYRTYC